MKDKYIICHSSEMNNYYKQGYILVETIQESYVSTESVSGTFMGNSINLYMPVTRFTTKILMQLTKSAEVLYGEKRENNS